MRRYFTIGMAGHIDHGKTTLTKALTGVDTDRLKEEKERSISIEPGFAPLILDEQLDVSIIDVPGHEKFIRQMIAGVAGIDMVILVIAADEGIMPQTKEHLDILSLLGINHGCVVLTKIDESDEDLLDIIVDDVKEHMKHTFLDGAPIYFVDSLSNKGIPELKDALKEKLLHTTKENNTVSFRLPIDHVFTVKGQGVVVRGTIYDGEVRQGERLTLLPSYQEVRVRQIQNHYQQKMVALKGQRAAINIGGISHDEVSRGNVLVADDYFSVTDRIDVVFYPLDTIKYNIKQRQPIKLYVHTSEVMGKIVFFDRNEINVHEKDEILCQIQLDEKVVVTRGDRFIIRRPTPVETIGGGWVLEPKANKHRFGQKTIEQLKVKKEGSGKDRIVSLMEERPVLTRDEIIKGVAIPEEVFNEAKQHLLEVEKALFTLQSTFEHVKDHIIHLIETYHERFPMRIGINKAEIRSKLNQYPVSLIEFTMEELSKTEQIKCIDQYVSLADVTPTLPSKWKTTLERVEKELTEQGVEVEKWTELLHTYDIPSHIQDEFYYYLIQAERAFIFDNDRLISRVAIEQARNKLEEKTKLEDFNLQTARDILQLTRKNLVPFLELLDRLGYTKRLGNMRTWINK